MQRGEQSERAIGTGESEASTPSLALPLQWGGDITDNGLSGFKYEIGLNIWNVFNYETTS
jgi:hypothetical protein